CLFQINGSSSLNPASQKSDNISAELARPRSAITEGDEKNTQISTLMLAHDDIDDTKYQTPEIKKNMIPISTNVLAYAKSHPQIYNITKEGIKNYLL
ncbi:2187_t:CDS:2, partial [Acaulospora morrowiae]